eukprot:scaffold57674_cov60-Cyclotella_meneghiniana.AAC.1
MNVKVVTSSTSSSIACIKEFKQCRLWHILCERRTLNGRQQNLHAVPHKLSCVKRIVEQLTARELDPVNRQRQQVFTVVHCHHHAPVIRQNTFLRTRLIADRHEYSACVKRRESVVVTRSGEGLIDQRLTVVCWTDECSSGSWLAVSKRRMASGEGERGVRACKKRKIKERRFEQLRALKLHTRLTVLSTTQ